MMATGAATTTSDGRYDSVRNTTHALASRDESYHSFINANRIHPGIIATQCPLENTVQDVLQMVVEQRVALWIQLAPSASSQSQTCRLFPEGYKEYSLRTDSADHSQVPTASVIAVHEVRYLPNEEAAFTTLSIDLWYPSPSSLHDDTKRESDENRPTYSASRWSQHTLLVERYLHWEDFEVPSEDHHKVAAQLRPTIYHDADVM